MDKAINIYITENVGVKVRYLRTQFRDIVVYQDINS